MHVRARASDALAVGKEPSDGGASANKSRMSLGAEAAAGRRHQRLHQHQSGPEPTPQMTLDEPRSWQASGVGGGGGGGEREAFSLPPRELGRRLVPAVPRKAPPERPVVPVQPANSTLIWLPRLLLQRRFEKKRFIVALCRLAFSFSRYVRDEVDRKRRADN